MKNSTFASVIIGAVALAAVFLPSRHEERALAAGSAVTLMNAQTAAGPGRASATTQATPAEGGADRYVFQYHATGADVNTAIEQSNDSGSTWALVHTFRGPDEVWSVGVCGPCLFRANKVYSSTETATVILTMGGGAVPLAPSYTPTATPTVTRTPTVTPTHP
jgi:hypothetical protein